MTPTFIIVTDTEETTSVCIEVGFIISAVPIPELSEIIQAQTGVPKGAKTAIKLKNMMNVYCDEKFEDVIKLLDARVAPGSIIKTVRPKVVVVEAIDNILKH